MHRNILPSHHSAHRAKTRCADATSKPVIAVSLRPMPDREPATNEPCIPGLRGAYFNARVPIAQLDRALASEARSVGSSPARDATLHPSVLGDIGIRGKSKGFDTWAPCVATRNDVSSG
jgi:hypothetical protein